MCTKTSSCFRWECYAQMRPYTRSRTVVVSTASEAPLGLIATRVPVLTCAAVRPRHFVGIGHRTGYTCSYSSSTARSSGRYRFCAVRFGMINRTTSVVKIMLRAMRRVGGSGSTAGTDDVTPFDRFSLCIRPLFHSRNSATPGGMLTPEKTTTYATGVGSCRLETSTELLTWQYSNRKLSRTHPAPHE